MEKCEALMSRTRSSDKRTSFFCYLINCLSFQNTGFDFKKHLKKIRSSPHIGAEGGGGSASCRQGRWRGEKADTEESVTKTTKY